MIKKFVASICLLSSFLMTGCAVNNLAKVEKYPDLTKTEDFIIKGESTARDVREIFGTPTFVGKTKDDGHIIYAYAIVSDNDYGATLGENILHSFKTLGLGGELAHGTAYTQKNVYFKFNSDNKVEDIKYKGYAWMSLGSSFSTYYNQALTDEEFKSSQPMLVNNIVESFSNKNVSTDSIKKYELDRKIDGFILNVRLCFIISGRLFNQDVLFVSEKDPSESYDGIKSSLLFDKVEFSYM